MFVACSAQASPTDYCLSNDGANSASAPVACADSSNTLQTGPTFGRREAESPAASGGVGVSATAYAQWAPVPGQRSFLQGADAYASLTLSDLTISSTENAASVLAPMNHYAHLDGQAWGMQVTGSGTVKASAVANWGVHSGATGNLGEALENLQRVVHNYQGTFADVATVSGDFGSTDIASVLAGEIPTPPNFSLPVGSPFGMTLWAEAGALAGWTDCFLCADPTSAYISIGALDTFGFPIAGPIFNLPDGYTVNSLDGLIMDNRFVGVASVPEPATPSLLGPGLVGLGFSPRKH